MTILISLNQIRAHKPCTDGWQKLLASKGKTGADDEPFPLLDVLDSNGLDDALWCLRCLPEHDRLWRSYAVWCVRQVQHLMTDPRSLAALDVAERYSRGEATDEELAAARAAAWEAVSTAESTAERAAARAAARDAAGAAARDAAITAASAEAWVAARGAQAAKLREMLV